jgi:hypothetical protein
MFDVRSSFEPHHGEISTGNSSFVSQPHQGSRHFESDPAETSTTLRTTATPCDYTIRHVGALGVDDPHLHAGERSTRPRRDRLHRVVG